VCACRAGLSSMQTLRRACCCVPQQQHAEAAQRLPACGLADCSLRDSIPTAHTTEPPLSCWCCCCCVCHWLTGRLGGTCTCLPADAAGHRSH
jgi:hypothetical protein